MKHRLWLIGLISAFLACVPSQSFAETILTSGWRGDGTGRFPDTRPPTKWSKNSENILWKLEVPGRGYSSPVLSPSGDNQAGRLFITAEPSDLICIDAENGEILWRKTADYAAALGQAKADQIAETYAELETEKRAISKRYDTLRKSDPELPQLEPLKQERKAIDQRRKEFERQYPAEKRGGAGNAAATVVCDSQRVFALFGTGIVAAFSVDGEPLWIRHTEAPQQGFGHSASPVLAGGRLVLHMQQLIGLGSDTGSEAWRVDVPAKFGTPAVTRIGDEDVVITPSGTLIGATDGRILAEKQFQLSENSPLVHDSVLYAHEKGSVRAFRLPESLEEPFTLELLWQSSGARDQRMASAVYHDGLLYAGGRRGVMDVIDAVTGDLVYRKRLEIGELFPSAVFAGGLIFIFGKNGRTLVLRPGREYDEVAANELERFSSTPVFVGRRMYLRAGRFLLCIGE
jgi:outer membrane protein assembly factor BamB